MKRMYVEETLLIKNSFEADEVFILDNFDDYSYFKIQVGDFLFNLDNQIKYFEYHVNESNILDDECYMSDDNKISIVFDRTTKKITVEAEEDSNFGILIKGVKY